MAVRRREPHLSLDPDKLQHQFQVRGHSARSFAKVAHISVGTLSGILQHGKPCSPATARKIAQALWTIQPINGLQDIMQVEEN